MIHPHPLLFWIPLLSGTPTILIFFLAFRLWTHYTLLGQRAWEACTSTYQACQTAPPPPSSTTPRTPTTTWSPSPLSSVVVMATSIPADASLLSPVPPFTGVRSLASTGLYGTFRVATRNETEAIGTEKRETAKKERKKKRRVLWKHQLPAPNRIRLLVTRSCAVVYHHHYHPRHAVFPLLLSSCRGFHLM